MGLQLIMVIRHLKEYIKNYTHTSVDIIAFLIINRDLDDISQERYRYENIEIRAIKLIQWWQLGHEKRQNKRECGLITLETRILKSNQIWLWKY